METSLQRMHTSVKNWTQTAGHQKPYKADIRTTMSSITSKKHESEAVLRALALEEINN